MDMGSQVPMKCSCVDAHTTTPPPHTHTGPLTWHGNTKVLWVLCHHFLLQLMQSGSQRPWETKGMLNRDPAELPPTPSGWKPAHPLEMQVTYQSEPPGAAARLAGAGTWSPPHRSAAPETQLLWTSFLPAGFPISPCGSAESSSEDQL